MSSDASSKKREGEGTRGIVRHYGLSPGPAFAMSVATITSITEWVSWRRCAVHMLYLSGTSQQLMSKLSLHSFYKRLILCKTWIFKTWIGHVTCPQTQLFKRQSLTTLLHCLTLSDRCISWRSCSSFEFFFMAAVVMHYFCTYSLWTLCQCKNNIPKWMPPQ